MQGRGINTAVLLAVICSLPQAWSAGPKWQGHPPEIGKESSAWTGLLEDLSSRGMHFGTMAASARILVFFNDLSAKEAAYKSVIGLVDQGYPFSVQSLFLAGDIAPEGDPEFANSYNLYKTILNKERGMETWAKYYSQKVDPKDFPKYLFYEAVEAYGRKDFKVAGENLKKVLAQDYGPDRSSFVKKAARTLARVYFEQEDYARSWDVYSSFLLKTQPLLPSDWVEAAWSLYRLKRPQEAVGMLYNLESKAASGTFVNLEKYTIRALVYRSLCAVASAEALIESFEKEFGSPLQGIKRGEPLAQYPQLMLIEVPENAEYRQVSLSLPYLRRELAAVSKLPKERRALATYLYQSEITMLQRRRKGLVDQALRRAAEKLLLMGEHLRFLKFDVQRERFNPDVVFKRVFENDLPALEELPDARYRLKWNQLGDFWRDERDKYQGSVTDQCGT